MADSLVNIGVFDRVTNKPIYVYAHDNGDGTSSLQFYMTLPSGIVLPVAGDVASGAADGASKPVKVGGVYRAAGVTLADGQRGDLQLDINAFLKATLGTLFYGEDSINNLLRTEEHWSWAYITSATNTVVKSGAGVFGVMIVVGGTAGTITAFDNTAASGTTIFAMDSTNAIAAYPFKAAFATGLTITTGAATKVFIGYR